MNSAGKCFECPMKKNCRYASITGNSFHDYPGLLCSVDQFEQRRYKPGERLTASLYWIGDCESFKSIAELAVSNMNQRLNGCFFYLQSVRHCIVPEEIREARSISILLPVDRTVKDDTPLDVFHRMNDWYEEWYNTRFIFPEISGQWIPGMPVSLDAEQLPTRRLQVKGRLGTVKFPSSVEISNVWELIGAGRTNCIGGGKIEINDQV